MGAADTVPGVSGGTVALILGHYQRLILAISRIDGTFISHVAGRQFFAAFRHVDGRFLAGLLAGILSGIVLLAGLMHWLLEHHLPGTLAVFLGMVLASVWVVRNEVRRWTPDRMFAAAAGAAVAIAITMISQQGESLSLPYLFLCASIAICAMILPGVSGAFLLLLLGTYHGVTGLVKNAARGQITAESALQLVVFACGCLFGLLAFSKLLRFLLARFRDLTMASLVGLMIGSIGRLWPFQVVTPETAELEFKYRQFDYVSPTSFDGSTWLIAALIFMGVAVVIVAERIASDTATDDTAEP